MRNGQLAEAVRNKLLASMTDEVSELVLEDNRPRSIALVPDRAAGAFPARRTIEMLEASGRLDRKVEGLESSDDAAAPSAMRQGLHRSWR
jgi:glutamate dehydrogenase